MTTRRRRKWEDFLISEVTADGTQDTHILTIDSGTNANKGRTLVRLIVGIDVIPDGAVENSVDNMNVALGIGMVSTEAFNAGAFPDPNTSLDSPLTGWMWRWNGTVYENPESTRVRIDFDIRSQRKLMYGFPVLIINADANSGTPFNVETRGLIRCLYLED